MCGGRGTRLDAPVEKPLLEVGGRPMVERVIDALAASRIDRVYAVVSPHAPETRAALDVPHVETPGEGYVADLERALADDRVSRPVLTAAADLPLLAGACVDELLDAARGSLAAAVPVGRKRALGLRAEARFRHGGTLVAPAGVNVVGDGDDEVWLTRDRRLAVNVNRPAEARVAEWIAAGRASRKR